MSAASSVEPPAAYEGSLGVAGDLAGLEDRRVVIVPALAEPRPGCFVPDAGALLSPDDATAVALASKAAAPMEFSSVRSKCLRTTSSLTRIREGLILTTPGIIPSRIM